MVYDFCHGTLTHVYCIIEPRWQQTKRERMLAYYSHFLCSIKEKVIFLLLPFIVSYPLGGKDFSVLPLLKTFCIKNSENLFLKGKMIMIICTSRESPDLRYFYFMIFF